MTDRPPPAVENRVRPEDAYRTRGEDHHAAKLTEAKVEAIRQAAADGLSLLALSKRFEVCRSSIRKIVTGETWKQAPGPILPQKHGRSRGEDFPGAMLTEVKVEAIRQAAADGATAAELAREHGVCQTAAAAAIAGKTWKHVPGPRRVRHGPVRGEDHYAHKLTDAKVAIILRDAAAGVPLTELAGRHDVPAYLVDDAVSGKTWKHVPGPRRARGQAAVPVKLAEGTYRVFGEVMTIPARAKGQRLLVDVLIEAGESGLSTFSMRNICSDYRAALDRLRVPGSAWSRAILPPDVMGNHDDHWRIFYIKYTNTD